MEIDRLGFVSLDEPISPDALTYYYEWLREGKHAGMDYLERYPEIRRDPSLLMEGARSIIVCAVSYYPTELQPTHAPQVAKYAYSRDYHKVLPQLLKRFAERINDEVTPHSYRVCTDTAPLFERYWARRSGVGFIGRNQNLIIPGIGSFLFLGEILTTLPLKSPRKVAYRGCGPCRRCIDNCPTGALSAEGMDARRCISYLTIEHRDEIPEELSSKFGTRFFGCDTCQDVCPFNHRPRPQRHFPPLPQVLHLSSEELRHLTALVDNAETSTTLNESYLELFAGTPLTRSKLSGILRNAFIYLRNNRTKIN